MKRSRLIKCLTVTKANFRIRTTCYLFFIVFCSVFFSLSFSCCCCRCCCFFYLLFSWLCVCFVNIIIFRLCFQYNRHCRVSHLFLSDLSKSNACCAHGEYLQGENMNLFSFGAFFFFFSSFVLRFSFWLLRLIQFQSGYVRIEEKNVCTKSFVLLWFYICGSDFVFFF